MIKKYFYITLLFGLLGTANAVAQESKGNSKAQDNAIEGLSIYPNPTTGDRVYITSKSSDDKEITIYDVLGKKVLQTTLTSRELNISSLSPGVYIVQVKEGDATATRKLIVK
ncbi:T9SS type A sorting domain-containing protein [Flavobacterium croceum]|uniref:Putative secreted protein (Por secretion system target) n=1 Tax=Flavobacterium croceum DSM 17960 TaxID=1121886 RepID=A0A2S4N668_9FLAO|nr:T9SS type A sorting domain-containing protein [Flavobacterium croceum]POS01215.1 putative secreted protein (Por secretion system target) [Flavobacterium croceum DSM 17960]